MGVISNGTTLLDAGALDSGIATGAMTLISTTTASSSSTISFTGIDSTYKELVFKFINIHSSSDNSDFVINFSDDAIDHSLSEVAKTFHWREFGNGAANMGNGGTWADFTMHINNNSTADSLAYVMDDGLTYLTGSSVRTAGSGSHIHGTGNGHGFHFSFIGTGITV